MKSRQLIEAVRRVLRMRSTKIYVNRTYLSGCARLHLHLHTMQMGGELDRLGWGGKFVFICEGSMHLD